MEILLLEGETESILYEISGPMEYETLIRKLGEALDTIPNTGLAPKRIQVELVETLPLDSELGQIEHPSISLGKYLYSLFASRNEDGLKVLMLPDVYTHNLGKSNLSHEEYLVDFIVEVNILFSEEYKSFESSVWKTLFYFGESAEGVTLPPISGTLSAFEHLYLFNVLEKRGFNTEAKKSKWREHFCTCYERLEESFKEGISHADPLLLMSGRIMATEYIHLAPVIGMRHKQLEEALLKFFEREDFVKLKDVLTPEETYSKETVKRKIRTLFDVYVGSV